MCKIFLFIIVTFFLSSTCKTEPKSSSMEEKPTVIEKSTIPASPKVEQEKINLPQYSVLNEDIYDAPIKTQIALRILVQNDTTEQGLRNLINHLYSNLKKRTGFKYHSSFTNIYIYMYATKEEYEAGTEYWIIMLAQNFGDIPRIYYPNLLRY